MPLRLNAMGSAPRIITLLTDFGLRDQYVASMKGVMLSINPSVNLIDITHQVPPQDILAGAFILDQAARCFPVGTVHLAVVDPGVGTERKVIIAKVGEHLFVAPDNGLLSFVLGWNEDITIHEVTAEHYYRKPVSSTFHGRDVFAPVAGYLSRDIPPGQFGEPMENPVRLKIPTLIKVKETLMQASVLAVDQFGNIITNLEPGDVPAYRDGDARPCKVLAGKREISTFRRTFAEGKPGDLFVLPGSSGYLEIVVREGSAASELGLKPGAPVGVVIG